MRDKAIVITRPVGDEKILTDLFHSHGYRVIHEPLTSIYLQHTQRLAVTQALLDEPNAVIITSRHGAQALSLLSDLRDAFLICVGEATANTAISLGFMRVSIAGGTAQKLIEHIVASYDAGSRFLYVSGEHVRVDIESELATHGMNVQRLAIYEAIASDRLSDTLVEQLRRQQLDGITLLSQRTANIFTTLLEKAGAQECVNYLHGFCLSAAVAEPLLSQPWKGIHVTDEATLASLLESVDNVFKR